MIERRQKGKKLCCIILSFMMLCSLVGGVTLNTGTAYADSNDGATDGQDKIYDQIMDPGVPEDYDADSTVNPYTNDNQKFLLVEQNELMVNMSWNKDNHWITMADTYSEGKSMKLAAGSASDKAGWESVYGNENPSTPFLSYQNGIAFDPNGTGRKDHVAYVGWKGDHNYLWVYDTVNKKASEVYQLEASFDADAEDWEDDMNYLTAQNFYSITAGDYNDDGVDTLVVYNPADKGDFSILEYRYENGTFTKLGSSKRMLHDIYCQQSNIYDVNKIYCKLGCNLTTGDFDGDGVDDLGVVSYGGDYGDYCERSDYRLFTPMIAAVFGDDQDSNSDGAKWSIVESGEMQKDYSAFNKDVQYAYEFYDSMRSPSISAGDLDGDGYDELLCAGIYSQIKLYKGQAAYGSFAEFDTMTGVAAEVSRKNINLAGSTFSSNEWTKNSARHHKYTMKIQVATECVAINGQAAAETAFINGTFYQYTGTGFVKLYTPNYFDTDDKYIGGAETAAMAVTDVVSGVFDGNDQGREQVMFTISQKEWGVGSDIYVTFGAMGGKNYNEVNIAGGYYSSDIDGDHYSLNNKGDDPNQYLNACVVAMDNDQDGVVGKFRDKDYVYSDPKTAAILQAGPAFSTLDEYGGYDCTCETSYSMATTYERGTTEGYNVSFSAGVAVDVEFKLFVDLESAIRLGYAQDWNKTFEKSVATTYSTSFSAQTHDQVVVSRIPVTIYNYDIYDEDGNVAEGGLAISAPGKPVYYQLGVDEYNTFVDDYNTYINENAESKDPVKLKKVTTAKAGSGEDCDLPADNTGKPENYFTSWGDAGEGATNLSSSPIALSYNNGNSNVSWTRSDSTTETMEKNRGFSFDASVITGENVIVEKFAAGGYASLNYLNINGTYETNVSENGVSGTVQNLNEANLLASGLTKSVIRSYGFQWEFGTWQRELTTRSGDFTPFVGYRVWNVTMPPHAPENLEADYSDTDGLNSIQLTWDAVDDSNKVLLGYNVYIKDGETYTKINDSLVKDTSYIAKNLKTNKEYTFVVTAEAYLDQTGKDKIKTGESLWSNEAEIETARSDYKITLTSDRGATIKATSGGKSISSGDKVFEGNAVFIEAKAKSGYTITQILLKKAGEKDLDITSTAGEFNFVVKGDTEIVVTSKRSTDESEIHYSVKGNGSIISATSDGVSFRNGATVSGEVVLTAKADEGYVLKEWIVTTGTDSQTFAANGNDTYTFSPFASKHTIEAVFVSADDPDVVRTIQMKEITGNGKVQVSDSKGNILKEDANGRIKVNVGTPVTFEAKPDKSYVFRGWTGDFAAVPKETTTIEHTVYEDVEVGAEFYAPVKYKVKYIVNNAEYGTIETDIKNNGLYASGTDMTFKAIPADGYRLQYWNIVEGNDVTVITTKERMAEYKLDLELKDMTQIEAHFKKTEEFHLNIADSDYGTIKVSDQTGKSLKDGDTILFGDVLTVTAEPKQYHELKTLKINGTDSKNGSEILVKDVVSVNAKYLRLLSEDGKALPDVEANLSFTSAKYTGEEIKPDVTLTVDGKTLKKDTDFTVTYADNKDPGKATVTIEGKGFYKGTVVKTFEIVERFTVSIPSAKFGSIKVVNQDKVQLKDGDYIYDGDVLTVAAEPDQYCELVNFKVNGEKVSSGFEVEVDQNIKTEASFVRLLSKDGKALPDVKVTLPYKSTKYTGSSIKPSVTVTVAGKELTSSDYSVSYSNNKLPGTATVTITGKGSYKGTVKTTFTIKENSELHKSDLYKGMKLSSSSGKVSMKWGTVDIADGYDVFLAKCGSNFSSKPSVTTKKTSISVTKVSGKKISSKYNYKAMVKAYRTENGKKHYIAVGYTIHTAGSKTSYTNPKEITGVPTSKSLSVGKTYTIKASVTKSSKSKSLLTKHAETFRYKTSNSAVATVSSSGKITAKGKGTCTVTVITINGMNKRIKVTVK